MHSTRLRTQGAQTRLRQDVLTGVLLHVIEAAQPIHRALYCPLQALRNHVHDPVLLVFEHVDHGEIIQRPGVVGLSSRGRVEGCAIEDHADMGITGMHVDDRRVELTQVAVRVVQTVRHREAGRGAGARKGIRAAATACSSAAWRSTSPCVSNPIAPNSSWAFAWPRDASTTSPSSSPDSAREAIHGGN